MTPKIDQTHEKNTPEIGLDFGHGFSLIFLYSRTLPASEIKLALKEFNDFQKIAFCIIFSKIIDFSSIFDPQNPPKIDKIEVRKSTEKAPPFFSDFFALFLVCRVFWAPPSAAGAVRKTPQNSPNQKNTEKESPHGLPGGAGDRFSDDFGLKKLKTANRSRVSAIFDN